MLPVSIIRRRLRRSALWTPAQISTALWLDASDASSITLNGSNVSQWNDKSGNGRNAVQATAINQPTYQVAGLNNKPAIEAGSGLRYMWANLNQAITTSSAHIFVVFRTTVISANQLFDLRNSNDATPLLDDQATSGFSVRYRNNAGVITSASTLTQDTNSNLGVYSFQDNTISVRVKAGVSSASVTGQITVNRLSLWSNGAGPSTSLQGIIGEVVMVTNSLTTAERQLIEGYLAWKWGGF